MMQISPERQHSDVRAIARRSRIAARTLATTPDELRRAALHLAADLLVERRAEILRANEQDVSAAERAVASGQLTRSMLARLKTSERGIHEMAARVRDVAGLEDPLNRLLTETELDDNLILRKTTCPLGVVAIVFESRPDVISQVASLTLRSGNAVIFKGGSEASNTNEVLIALWRDALQRIPPIAEDSINSLTTRADV